MPFSQFKGVVHPKIVINYSPSCHSKLVRPSFIFGTQIKIFLMKSERFLSLHIWTAMQLTRSRPRKVVRTYIPCDISGSTLILWSYENTFCVQKKASVCWHIHLIPLLVMGWMCQCLELHLESCDRLSAHYLICLCLIHCSIPHRFLTPCESF